MKVQLTHTNKVFWPAEGYTKGDVIAYYNKMAPYILPYLTGRPESLNRHPDGIAGPWFYQKNVGRERLSSFVTTTKVRGVNRKAVNYVVCDNKQTLLWLANFGCIGMHPWSSHIGSLNKPDYLTIDLDPHGRNFNDVVAVALGIKKILDRAKVKSFPKTSGKTGLHIMVPLGARYTYREARAFATLLIQKAHQEMPDLTTLEQRLNKRRGKIYLDIARNAYGQTCAAPYALRAYPGATVSTPLAWREVKKGLRPDALTIKTIFRRLQKRGDLFKGVLGKGADLKRATSILKDSAVF